MIWIISKWQKVRLWVVSIALFIPFSVGYGRLIVDGSMQAFCYWMLVLVCAACLFGIIELFSAATEIIAVRIFNRMFRGVNIVGFFGYDRSVYQQEEVKKILKQKAWHLNSHRESGQAKRLEKEFWRTHRLAHLAGFSVYSRLEFFLR